MGQIYKYRKIGTLVSSIKLNATSIQLDKGAIYTLSATINPTDATITDILWTSSNPQVATVDRSGKVIALSTGTTTISATIIDGSDVSASCVVAVGNAGITDVKSDNTATEVARYDINGRMLAQPTKGINIIKMSDGSIRKEWVKE
ncbi:MAG: Ig domain-containing protein [Muribaculaceae bacterium]|nr:Ig domain-containing protein [Muribaculaceae bacterium]